MGKGARLRRERLAIRGARRDPRETPHRVVDHPSEEYAMLLLAHEHSYLVDIVDWESGAEVRCPGCGVEVLE